MDADTAADVLVVVDALRVARQALGDAHRRLSVLQHDSDLNADADRARGLVEAADRSLDAAELSLSPHVGRALAEARQEGDR